MIVRSKFHERVMVFENQFADAEQYMAQHVSSQGKDCVTYQIHTIGMKECLYFRVDLINDYASQLNFTNLDKGTNISVRVDSRKVLVALEKLVDDIFAFEDLESQGKECESE